MSKDTIFKQLRKDHDRQRNLFEILVETSGDSKDRRDLYEKLKINLQEHAKFEEKYFYSDLMSEDMTIEKSRHSIHEHHKIDKLIEEIDGLDFSSPQWLLKLKSLQELVEHHLDEEEHEVFQMAGKVLSENQKINLGERYNQATAGI